MTYALVIDAQILSEGAMPTGARRLDTGRWVTPPGGVWPTDLAAACGYLPVTDAARPADTAGTTWDRTLTLAAGVPTVVWVERAKTAGEVSAAAAASNETTLQDRARAALTANATFLAIAAPTNAQTLAQVQRLTKETNALIRLAVRALDTITDTA